MADLIKINPASGDSHATLFSGASSSSGSLGTVEKGTLLKVLSRSGKYYQVAYDNKLPPGCRGSGTCMSGMVVAEPFATVYKDKNRRHVESYANNATTLKILDDSNPKIFKVRVNTRDGVRDCWIETRFIMRDSIDPEEFGEISNKYVDEGDGTSG